MRELLLAYAATFGWALVGSVSMGMGLVVALTFFTWCTRGVDEWKLVKEGSVPMGLILGAVVVACGLVVASAIRP